MKEERLGPAQPPEDMEEQMARIACEVKQREAKRITEEWERSAHQRCCK